jgi:hypothetical protein
VELAWPVPCEKPRKLRWIVRDLRDRRARRHSRPLADALRCRSTGRGPSTTAARDRIDVGQ